MGVLLRPDVMYIYNYIFRIFLKRPQRFGLTSLRLLKRNLSECHLVGFSGTTVTLIFWYMTLYDILSSVALVDLVLLHTSTKVYIGVSLSITLSGTVKRNRRMMKLQL